MSHPIKTIEGITKESTQELIDKTLEVYPEKAKKKRAPHLGANDQASGSRLRQVQQEDRSRRHECPRLRLCRRQRGCLGPDPRYGPCFPWPGRLRLVLLGYPAQPDDRQTRR